MSSWGTSWAASWGDSWGLVGGGSPSPPVIITVTLADGDEGAAYSSQLVATGSPTPTWSVTAGVLPAGLTLSAGGLISGTPTTYGSFAFTVQALNTEGSDTQALGLELEAFVPGYGLDTSTERVSAMNLNLPFARSLFPSGGNLDLGDERYIVGLTYAIIGDGIVVPPDPGGGGVDTATERVSALNINLPFGRSIFPSGGDLDLRGERYIVGLTYAFETDAPTLLREIVCSINSQDAGCGCTVQRLAKVAVVRPAPPVTGRVVQWDAIVASARLQGREPVGKTPIPVYTFGAGRNARNFTELI